MIKLFQFQVQCFPLQAVLSALKHPKVDYFSLDIEGAEYAVLKTLDLNQVKINTFGIEVNHAGEIFNGTRKQIQEYLELNSYKFVGQCKIDDFYVLNK